MVVVGRFVLFFDQINIHRLANPFLKLKFSVMFLNVRCLRATKNRHVFGGNVSVAFLISLQEGYFTKSGEFHEWDHP